MLQIMNIHDYSGRMCWSTNLAKISSGFAIGFSIIPLLIGLFLHFSRFQRMFEYYISLLACVLSIFTIICSIATFVFMISSPLFSNSHIEALSAAHHGIPFHGFYSCSLTTPLHSILSLPFSASLECLFPGPAFLAPILLVLGQSIAAAFFWMISKNIYLASKTYQEIPDVSQSSSPLISSSNTSNINVNEVEDETLLNFQYLLINSLGKQG